jgi:hypothetical protein
MVGGDKDEDDEKSMERPPGLEPEVEAVDGGSDGS